MSEGLFQPLKFRARVRWLTWLLLVAFLSLKSGEDWPATLLAAATATLLYQILRLW